MMKPNYINIVLAICVAGLLAWWLGTMGEDTMQKWVLGAAGGFMIAAELTVALGFSFLHPRSGLQVKLVNMMCAVITFVLCCIYSFFQFSAISFCVPMGLIFLIDIFISLKIYRTQM